jgi:hypothetical protein
MAETAVQTNNKAVINRGRPMPVVSKAQNAAMHEAAEGNSNIGIPASVGKEFVEASHGENVGALPKYADGKHKSPNPGAAHIDDYHDDDDDDREMRGRANHLLKQGQIRPEDHARMNEHINMMKKAKRPNMMQQAKPVGAPGVAYAGENNASMGDTTEGSGPHDSEEKRSGETPFKTNQSLKLGK